MKINDLYIFSFPKSRQRLTTLPNIKVKIKAIAKIHRTTIKRVQLDST